jgi:tetraacyldisaccharide 4'-kinase
VLRAPEFWQRPGSPVGALLAPLGAVYDTVGQLRAALSHPVKLDRPVLCVGNLTSGGAGKTPTALALAAWFRVRGRQPHFLTRGYGGREAGPVRVDPKRHDFQAVGDEPLLLAAAGPTWVARDRPAGARAAVAAGADLVIMDDGLQNPSLAKDLSLLVIDGGFGFGNGRVIPAGPLRETVAHGLARVQAAVLIGEDAQGLGATLGRRMPVLAARLVPDAAARRLAGRRVLAFAGIGRPQKFFATLEALGCNLVDRVGFTDHHAYGPDEIMRIVELAAETDAVPVTTEKDLMRFPAGARPMVTAVRVTLEWRDEAALERLLRPLLDSHG